MLRQAVKLFLHQQNRLSFSSLRCVVRHLQTLNNSNPWLTKTFIERRYRQKSCFRYVHSTLVCECVQKKVKTRNDKIHSKERDSFTNNLNNDKNDLDVACTDEIREFEDCGTVDKRKLKIRKLMGDNDENYFSDVDNDSAALGNELVPHDRQGVKHLEKKIQVGKSLIPTNTYYRPKSIVQSLLDEDESVDIVSSEADSKLAELEEQYNLELVEKGKLQVQGVEKVVIPPLTNVAPFVNDSEVLKSFVQLGVDLSVVQKKGMIEQVLKMDFKKDVSPYIWFLKDCGVPADNISELITNCPWIFQHDVNNLKVRIDYLRSKKFTHSHIANMLEKDPKFLLIPVDRIDAKLGFLQQEFRLTGKQIRETVGALSKLIIAKPVLIKENKFYMKKFLGFTENELRTMFLTYAKIFLYDLNYVADRFDYLHNIMELQHGLIAKTPQAMKKSRLKLESRHRFLVKCGRAQYDPTKPNYVSLSALITGTDDTWCFEVAKTSVAEYNQFLRLI